MRLPVSTRQVATIVRTAATFDVSGGAEESLGRVEGNRVDTTGERSSTRRHGQVVGAGESGDRVEQDRDIPTGFDQSLGSLERHLGDLGVVLDRLIECRRDDLAFDRPPHIGHFFRSLADQADHQVHVRVSWW